MAAKAYLFSQLGRKTPTMESFDISQDGAIHSTMKLSPIGMSSSSSIEMGRALKSKPSTRLASYVAKPTERATTKMDQPSLSAALKQIAAEDTGSYKAEDTQTSQNNTFNTRNTRFTRTRQIAPGKAARANSVPKEHELPLHGGIYNMPTSGRANSAPSQHPMHIAGVNNTATQSASFVLPDMTAVNELVSGKRRNGTPTASRDT